MHILLNVWSSLKHGQYTRNLIYKESSLPQKLSIASNFLSRGGTSCPLPLSMLRFHLAWAYAALLCAITTTYASLWSSTVSDSLTVFLFLFHGDRWVLTGLIDRDVLFKSKHSEISYSLHFDQFQSLWRIYSNPVQKLQRPLYQSFEWSGNARFDSAHRIDKYSQGTG